MCSAEHGLVFDPEATGLCRHDCQTKCCKGRRICIHPSVLFREFASHSTQFYMITLTLWQIHFFAAQNCADWRADENYCDGGHGLIFNTQWTGECGADCAKAGVCCVGNEISDILHLLQFCRGISSSIPTCTDSLPLLLRRTNLQGLARCWKLLPIFAYL